MTADGLPATSAPIPWVTVVIPYYDGSRTFGYTVRSLAAQDYRPLNLLVVDDGSREPPNPMLDAVVSRGVFPCEVIRHPTNQGLSRTLNDGWRRAEGEFVLILHQDIELLGADWMRRAVAALREREEVQVVTCHYGIPAREELNFASRAFGFLRRQFHEAPHTGREFVPFTEFKCDLIRKSALQRAGGFPENFRIAGEDILLSYELRRAGGRILKAYDLPVIQRFEGAAGSIRGNLWKEYRFGMALAGVLLAFPSFGFRDLDTSSYARSRSWHRASQPPVALAELTLLLVGLAPGLGWLLAVLALLVLVRFLAYAGGLWPAFRRSVSTAGRALVETLGAAFMGLITDIVYSAGLAVGLVRAAAGAPL